MFPRKFAILIGIQFHHGIYAVTQCIHMYIYIYEYVRLYQPYFFRPNFQGISQQHIAWFYGNSSSILGSWNSHWKQHVIVQTWGIVSGIIWVNPFHKQCQHRTGPPCHAYLAASALAGARSWTNWAMRWGKGTDGSSGRIEEFEDGIYIYQVVLHCSRQIWSRPHVATETHRWWWMDSGNHPLLWPNYSG